MTTPRITRAALTVLALTGLTHAVSAQRYDVREALVGKSTSRRDSAIVPSAHRIHAVQVGYNTSGVLLSVRFVHRDYMGNNSTVTRWATPQSGFMRIKSFSLGLGEFLERVEIRGTAQSIDYMKFTSNLGRKFETGPSVPLSSHVVNLTGYEFVGFDGFASTSNGKLVGVKPVKRPRAECTSVQHPLVGIGSVVEWTAGPYNHISEVKVRVRNGQVAGIKFATRDHAGAAKGSSSWLGAGSGGNVTTLTFPVWNYLKAIDLWYSSGRPVRLRITTRGGGQQTVGTGGSGRKTFASPDGCELIGMFGQEIPTLPPYITAFGASYRVVRGYSWTRGAGCGPQLSMEPSMDAGMGGQIGFNMVATGSAQFMFMSGTAGTFSNGGCTLWMPLPPLSLGFVVNAPQATLPIPYDASLLDARLFFQYLDVNLGGPFLGVGQLSNALGVRLGGPFSR